MRKFSKRMEKREEIRKSASPTPPQKDSARDQLLTLQQTVGNRAVEQLIHGAGQQSANKSLVKKSVDYRDEDTGPVVLNDPQGGTGSSGGPVAAKAPKAKQKKAGVDSFSVKWAENPSTTEKSPRLRLDFKAKFKDDDEHDPALAEFRQNAGAKLDVKDGPGKGTKVDIPMRDDNYSRADDILGRPKSDVNFESNDNPGITDAAGIDKDSDIDFAFTAEQMIIDTSQGNKVLEKVGPKTGTIKGKHPRKFSIPSNC